MQKSVFAKYEIWHIFSRNTNLVSHEILENLYDRNSSVNPTPHSNPAMLHLTLLTFLREYFFFFTDLKVTDSKI